MKCSDVKKLLSVYHDNRLSSSQTQKMENHLAVCRLCRQEERTLFKIWNMLEALGPIRPSPDFKTRFWQKAQEGSFSQTWWTSVVYSWNQFAVGARPVFALTSVLVISILGTLIALKVLPETFARGDKSPISQWAQSAVKGGLKL